MTSLYKDADCLGVITDIHAVLLALQIDYDVVLGGEGGGTLAPEDPTHGHPMLTQVEVMWGVVPLAPDYVELRWLGELPPSLLEMGPVTEGQKFECKSGRYQVCDY